MHDEPFVGEVWIVKTAVWKGLCLRIFQMNLCSKYPFCKQALAHYKQCLGNVALYSPLINNVH